MNNSNYDIIVVGGGLVGLSAAYKVQKNFPTKKILLVEKEKELAFHQSGRNSGVLHSGLYYKPGSYRAKNCVNGREQLVAFSKKHKINHDVCGKLVLATNQEEKEKLPALLEKGKKNGLTGLRIINRKQIKEIEPFVDGLEAIWVPQTGIIDYKQLAECIKNEIIKINNSSAVLTDCEVSDFDHKSIITNQGIFNGKNFIFCGGLFSDRLAKKDNLKLDLKIVSFRGEYYQLKTHSKHKIRNLVYPVPNPEFPFLGVHFTRMTDGNIECGPNAVFTFKREGYKKGDFNFSDTIDSLSYLPIWKLFFKHWRFGLDEYKRSFSKRLFLKQLQVMMPSLTMNDIEPGRTGVRAMALGKNGDVIDDFRIIENKKNIHVLNAPSPAATACLSIGDHILNKYISLIS